MINPTISATKKVLINAAPPQGYIAGLGRGATGFTTRSDIGPARLSSSDDPQAAAQSLPPQSQSLAAPPQGYVAGRGRGTSTTSGGTSDEPRDDSAAYNDAKFDRWSGFNDAGLFASDGPGDHEDDEADAVWGDVEEQLDLRRRRRREQRERQMVEQYRESNPRISVQFADAKRQLAEVSEEQWMHLPEVGDYTVKRKKMERYTPVPDSLLLLRGAANGAGANGAGMVTPGGVSSVANLRSFGEARESIVLSQLKKVEDSVTGKSTVNPKNYLSGLASINILGDVEVGDLKRARELLQNVTLTNPGHAPGWIARARVEMHAGKVAAARSLIMQGCEACPESEDVWIEAARLHSVENAKLVVAQAVKHIPRSVNVWIEATRLERDKKSKRRVLRKALEINPTSVALWKEAISLEDEEDAKVMLSRAVEVIPRNVDLWLALARLETYQNARIILNKAVRNMPNETLIWIAAATLEEENENVPNVEKVIRRGIATLQENKVEIKRDDWIHQAYRAEENQHLETCRAVIRCTIGIGIEDVDRKHTWIKDAKKASEVDHESHKRHIETARAIFAHALSVLPNKKSLWRRAAALEREFGTSATLLELLKRAVEKCPHAEDLWLMAAKEKWLAGDMDGARGILAAAFASNKDNEDIWLAAVKIESEAGETNRARLLLEQARKQASTARVWMKSAMFERSLNNANEERSLLDEGLKRFQQFDKLWMMRGQLEERLQNIDAAREIYGKGLKQCPQSIALWRCAVRLEANLKNYARARALLEKARLRNPKNEVLWLITVRVEMRAASYEAEQKNGVMDTTVAMAQLAKALQECPNSGILLAESIDLEIRAKQRAQAALALKTCGHDPAVVTTVSTLFWKERKMDRAREWFKRAVAAEPNFGDSWIHYYKFELENGTTQQQEEVLKQCEQADPLYGELWTLVSKKVENARLKSVDILQKAASQLDINIPRYKVLI